MTFSRRQATLGEVVVGMPKMIVVLQRKRMAWSCGQGAMGPTVRCGRTTVRPWLPTEKSLQAPESRVCLWGAF